MNNIKKILKTIKAKISRGTSTSFLLGFEWLGIIVLIGLLVFVSQPFPRQIILGILILFVFRYAHQIPFFRRFWIGFFGERKFWDWMTLLCAPLILSFLGLSISSSVNKNQGDISVVSDRLNISNEYYKQMSELIQNNSFQNFVSSRKKSSPTENNSNYYYGLELDFLKIPKSFISYGFQPFPKKSIYYPFRVYPYNENCNPIPNNPHTSIGYTRTVSTLKSLSKLRTSEEKYTPLKRGIIQLLYYSGLISRESHIISLQKADMSESDLSDIELSDSCFDSVVLVGSYLYKTKLSNSNLMRAELMNADLSFAKLDGVNLRGAGLMGAILRGANLQRADLRDANLSGADLRGAKLEKAIINANTNFKNAIYNTENLKVKKIKNDFWSQVKYYANFLINTEIFFPSPIELKPTSFNEIYLIDEFNGKESINEEDESTPKKKPCNSQPNECELVPSMLNIKKNDMERRDDTTWKIRKWTKD